ncbi:TA system VapC family ribonuclease toxin [Cyanobium sp. WAJ14-Wanaka]|uniref:TA system VapC family ribonuclease toxin n=1 Tax=Cyanobium sp. WAJ14-Wanaka TaxID=2823725 RepID=UPI0020CD0E12|nr:TA system VapC family ribonuclease toxin [Cyanobium sp. WAJ14-Wanaka]MCP9775775.1 PIN domain-containing protein [Cyanobium sp. WAJ14-Wanaka]
MSAGVLLDVNVLIALLDPLHVHHEPAHRWFAKRDDLAWASCALTQNAVLRILGHPRYPNSPGAPAAVAPVLQQLIHHPSHQFWADSLSLLTAPEVEAQALLDPAQISDTYLLAMAVRQQGRLASFDRRLVTTAVAGGSEALELIPV